MPTEAQKCDAIHELSISFNYVELNKLEGENLVKFAHQIVLYLIRLQEF